jgi:molybdopterin converting factor small subunit
VPDRLDATREVLRRAAEGHDLILTSGGVSVGEEDHVKPAVEAEGSLDMWKIAMKPGKPLAYGRVHGAAFIGLPGNPVSSFVTFLLMVRPFLLATQGVSEVAPARCSCAPTSTGPARPPARVPARAHERAGRGGVLRQPGLGGARVDGVGERPGRHPGRNRDRARRDGALPALRRPAALSARGDERTRTGNQRNDADMTSKVKILYFASLREAVGCAGEELDLPAGVATVGALRSHLAARGEGWQALAAGRNVRAALNQKMAAPIRRSMVATRSPSFRR